jgi:hypothetical protein
MMPFALALVLGAHASAMAAAFRCVEASRYDNLPKIFGGDPIALMAYLGVEKRTPPAANICRALAVTGSIRPGDTDTLLDKLIQGKGWVAVLYLSLEGSNLDEEMKLAAAIRGFALKTYFLSRTDWPLRYNPDFAERWEPALELSVSAAVQPSADSTPLEIGLDIFARQGGRSLPTDACRPVCDQSCALLLAAGVQRSASTAPTVAATPTRRMPSGAVEDNCTRAAFAAYLDKAPSVLSGFDAEPLREERPPAPPAMARSLRDKCGAEIEAVELLEKQFGETIARHARDRFHGLSTDQFRQDAIGARSVLNEFETLRRAAGRLRQCVARAYEAERLASFEARCSPNCDKPKLKDAFAAAAREFRDQVLALPAATGRPEPTAGNDPVGRILYRGMENNAPFTGNVTQTRANEWLETHSKGSYHFCPLARNASAILLYDPTRDIYVKLDLATQKFLTRAGAGQDWRPRYDIVTADAKPLPSPPPDTIAPKGLSRVTYTSRREKNINGEFKKNPKPELGWDWLELNSASRNGFCPYSETENELLLYDNGRDIHVRIDVAARKIGVRGGVGEGWTPQYEIGTIEREAAPATCTRISIRQTADSCNNCTAPPWNGEFNKIGPDEWTLSYVDGHNKPGSARWRVASQTTSELLLHDGSRDMYRRFDLAARKGFLRRGSVGSWVLASEILSTDCP